LNEWTNKRRSIAAHYNKLLESLKEVILPIELPNSKHVYHIYPIRVDAILRDELLGFLKEHGIEAGVHYPIALPSLRAYRYLKHIPSDFPVANQFSKQLISLPIYPELTTEQIEYVASIITLYFSKS
jgi:dTDP-4-amino-4,6-dideoxygalactose transaminase